MIAGNVEPGGLMAGVDAGMVAVLVALTALVTVGWLAARRLRRAVRRVRAAPIPTLLSLARGDPSVGRALARVRAEAPVGRALLRAQVLLMAPGPAREAARLRRDLQEALLRTRMSLAALPGDAPRGELPHLARRLERLAGPLDSELCLLVREPDRSLQAALLPGARTRVDALLGVARRLRAGAALVREGDPADVAELDTDVERELEALRAGVAALGPR
jgi:hypothetical protein